MTAGAPPPAEVPAEGSTEVRWAGVEDAESATEVLREAARWTARFGAPLWDPAGFTVEEHRALAAAGELVGGFDGGYLVACMRLQRADPLLWPEHPPGYARYVHKVAVRRSHAGRGWAARLVTWAVDEARRAGAAAVCLDTLPDGKLPAFYAALGFRRHDDDPHFVGVLRVVRMHRVL